MSKILGLITARGGSKGVPRKNVQLLAGRPLIAWTLEAAMASTGVDRTIVSTDDAEIAAVCRKEGGDVPFIRPAELARDNSPHIDVVQHAVNWLDQHDGYRPDYVLLLQPTSPLRTAGDVDGAIELCKERHASAVVSVVETHDHPYLMRRMDADNVLREFVKCDLAYARRQDLPPAFAINGAIYLTRRDVLLEQASFEGDHAIGYVMPPERSLQVDTPWDLHLAELVLRDRHRSCATASR